MPWLTQFEQTMSLGLRESPNDWRLASTFSCRSHLTFLSEQAVQLTPIRREFLARFEGGDQTEPVPVLEHMKELEADVR
jgi:hypothetical protein